MPSNRPQASIFSLRRAMALAAVAIVLPPAGWAADPPANDPASAVEVSGSGPLEATIVTEKLVERRGPDDRERREFVPARRLAAGEEVFYTIRVRNPGKEPVADVVVVKRMPQGVDYVRGSAAGPACDTAFSADEGASYGPEKKSGDYTHLRWTCRKPLAPGATALLRFRAIFR